MKKIVIPTDFSDNAWDALTYAIRLYDDIPTRFYILNTYEVVATGVNTTIYTGATKKLYNILKEDSEKELKKIENHLNEYLLNDKHEYKMLSIPGTFSSIVKELVDKEDIDLVVMGTTGASGMKKVFMGSNTVKLIKKIAKCPIIAVPKDFEYREPELISFATDLNKLFISEELNVLIELLLIHDLDLEILHVKKEKALSETQKQNIDLIKNLFNSGNVNYKGIDFEKSVSKTINNYTENNQVDIVCLARYEHNFLEWLTHKRVIKKVGFHTQVPLMTIPV